MSDDRTIISRLERAIENEINTRGALDDARGVVLRVHAELVAATATMRRAAEAHRAAVGEMAEAAGAAAVETA